MFLIDTDVLSALRKRKRNQEVVEWMAAQRTVDLYLSVVSIGEIERGIAGQQRRNPAFSRVLAVWLESVITLYGDRILNVSLSTARRWGRLSHATGHKNADLLIAATALEHGLTVVTGNVRDFEPTGVPVIDPSAPRK
jgi:predicted nucleic acid-binding protein